MSDEIKTAIGAIMAEGAGISRVESATMELVNEYFSPNEYGPHVRSRAGMLAFAAMQKGFLGGVQVAEMAPNLIQERKTNDRI